MYAFHALMRQIICHEKDAEAKEAQWNSAIIHFACTHAFSWAKIASNINTADTV